MILSNLLFFSINLDFSFFYQKFIIKIQFPFDAFYAEPNTFLYIVHATRKSVTRLNRAVSCRAPTN